MQQSHEAHSEAGTTLMAVGSTELGRADVPTRVLVVPWGEVASSKG